MTGKIEVICGSMFSGKTTELHRRVKRAMIAGDTVYVFKPRLDTRNQEHLQTHDGSQIRAENVANSAELLNRVESLEVKPHIIAIDEAQFFDVGITDVVNGLANTHNMRIILAGLDMDRHGKPFGPMGNLLATADDVTKLKAVCAHRHGGGRVCGREAYVSKLMVDDDNSPIKIGADDIYSARCREHSATK